MKIKMNYTKYTWVGNRINDADMQRLYYLKQVSRKPITKMVAEAVSEYLSRQPKIMINGGDIA